MSRIHRSSRIMIVALVLPGLLGCASMNRTTKGAVIGAAAGGAVGGVVGHATGSTARGVLIGAVIGGVAGGIIGRQMDNQARELERDIPGATVERVGEGILVTFDSGLLFDFDSDAIRGSTRHNLDELARSLDRYGDSDLMIVGHTDAVGSADYNQDLSERRAASASNYLSDRGVRSSRIGVRGRGEREPVASNESEDGRSRNRRVEVAIYASEAMRDEVQRESGR